MRIVAGRYRGQVLKSPPSTTTRPTTDRVKEALMSSLFSARGDFDGAWVLDAFAGSGALGLEALSRGAQRVWFYEKDNTVLRVLRGNIASLKGAGESVTVRRGDVFKAVPAPSHPFDIVFLDPPYATDPEEVAAFLARLEGAGSLSARALIHYEHAKSDNLRVAAALERLQWETVAAKVYGDIAFDILRRDN